MNCPICKTDITDPLKQFGGKTPICQSCWNDENEWAVEDDFILNELNHGATLEEACDTYARDSAAEMSKEWNDFEAAIFNLCLAIEGR